MKKYISGPLTPNTDFWPVKMFLMHEMNKVDSNKTTNTKLHTIFSFSDDLTSGIRGCTLKAFEENTIIAVASINRDRRRDGGSEPTNKYKQHQHLQLLLFIIGLRKKKH